jgi:Ca-activated chloride channel family protein
MFAHPAYLQFLWLLPLAAALLVYAHRKRTAAALRFVGEHMQPRVVPHATAGRAWGKGILLLTAMAAILVATAGPRHGEYFEKIERRGVDCYICLDVSRSMLADDVKPSRLERAKSDIRDLLGKLAGDRVGLIVFAGKAVVRVPLTSDENFFLQSLDDVDEKSAPRGGTLIGDAIRKAMEAMPKRVGSDQIIVLITDGEDQESLPEEAAKNAADRGIKIFTVGLGDSSAGARIPITDSSGKKRFVTDAGGEHWSKFDQELLKRIALVSGGAFVPAGTSVYDLGQIYEEHLAGLNRGKESDMQMQKHYREGYQFYVALGIALLGLERLIPRCARRNGRKGEA